MDMSKATIAVDRIRPGLQKYQNIMKDLHRVDVSKDMEFQKKYNGFYRMRQRKPDFYKEYYEYMETNKFKEISFSEVLIHFYNKFARVEASFCSKLAATIDPNQPVWDTYVIENLGLRKPPYSCKQRIEKVINVYEQLKKWYGDFLTTEDAKKLIYMFDSKYLDVNITDVKKIDLIIWQMR